MSAHIAARHGVEGADKGEQDQLLAGPTSASRVAEGPDKPWLTIREFAAAAGISAMTIYRLIQAGDFPAVRIGRRLFVPARLMEDLGSAAVARGRVVTATDWQEARE